MMTHVDISTYFS